MIGWLEDGLMCVLLFVDHLTALFRLFPLLYLISLLILITSISLSLRWPLPCQRVEVWIESLTSSVSVYLFQSNWLNRAIEFWSNMTFWVRSDFFSFLKFEFWFDYFISVACSLCVYMRVVEVWWQLKDSIFIKKWKCDVSPIYCVIVDLSWNLHSRWLYFTSFKIWSLEHNIGFL